jgi:hypothetical protein
MSAYLAYVMVAFLALINFTSANFDLYQVEVKFFHNIFGWHFMHKYMLFNDVATCAGNGKDKVYYLQRRDLSHGRLGVRCEGKCTYADVSYRFTVTQHMGKLVNSPG